MDLTSPYAMGPRVQVSATTCTAQRSAGKLEDDIPSLDASNGNDDQGFNDIPVDT